MPTTFSAESLTTVGVGVTAWLPIPTPWPTRSECSTQIYGFDNGSTLIGFDPVFASISPTTAIPCLPTEFTASWAQADTSLPSTTTLLGPTFVCPAAYTSAGELRVQSMQMLLCCPSNFLLATPITNLINSETFFPSQCTSSFTSGQTITYPLCTGGPGPCLDTTQTITAFQTVFAWHVNGFNVPQASSSLTTSTTSTSVVVNTNTNTNTNTAVAKSGSGLSTAAAAGVGIGVALAVMFLSIAGFLLWRQWKRKREYEIARDGGSAHSQGGGYSDTAPAVHVSGQYEMETPEVVRVIGRQEMDNIAAAKRHFVEVQEIGGGGGGNGGTYPGVIGRQELDAS